MDKQYTQITPSYNTEDDEYLPVTDPLANPLLPGHYAPPSYDLETLTLDQIVTEVVRCDDRFCPEYEYLYMEGVERILHIKWPQLEMDIVRCRDENRPDEQCVPLMKEVMDRAGPVFADAVNQKRLTTMKDPLLNYSGLQYLHPFWFDGVGEIWRRVAHGSRQYSFKDCKKLLTKSEQCLRRMEDEKSGGTNPLIPKNIEKMTPLEKQTCLRDYSEASACESGTICPYLRIPLILCMSKGDYEDPDTVQYKIVQNCFDKLPHYKACQVQYVPLTPEAFTALGLDSLSL
jgi:hypothetical protein